MNINYLKLTDKNLKLDFKQYSKDSGLDLPLLENVVLEPFNPTLISHGFGIELPEGYEAQIRPRSSTLYKYALHVAFGTIDNGYRGELKTCVINLSNAEFRLKAGMSISQLVITPVIYSSNIEFVQTEELNETSRNNKGFGSTGA